MIQKKSMQEIIMGMNNLHKGIATDVFPDGVSLRCTRCQREIAATNDDVANYLRQGWPRCCGYAMEMVIYRETKSDDIGDVNE
ncbi:MAG: hypothetical protein AAF614_11620 [Chloroflexota bacterium]